MTELYRLIARLALRLKLDGIAEWAARTYRAKTGKSALDDVERRP